MPHLDAANLLLDVAETVEDVVAHLVLIVRAIEVTQAIQYSRADQHLTDPADRGPDNSVILVSGKTAWARVYVRAFFGAIPNVTGTLEVQRASFGPFGPFSTSWDTVATLSPQPPGQVTAQFNPDYATERSTLDASLNFILPSDLLCGRMRLIARVESGTFQAQRTVDLRVHLRQTLRLRGVMIAYNGPPSSAPNAPNLNLAPPTLADLITTAATTLTLFPVRAVAHFSIAAAITWNRPLDDPQGDTGCSPNWAALLDEVRRARDDDENKPGWVYYGLLPTGVPIGPTLGCGGGGVGVSRVGAGMTMAHEIGHACGLRHAPCGFSDASVDSDYPAYEPYDPPNMPQASIGEYGLNINNGNIMSPATFKDWMSGCGPRWISLYHHSRLLNTTMLNRAIVCIDFPWWRNVLLEELERLPGLPLPDPPPFDWELPVTPPPLPPTNVISLIVAVGGDGTVEVRHVARIRTRPEVENSVRTAMVGRLRGKRGEILAEAPLMRLPTHSCGCREAVEGSGPFLAQAFLADAGPGTTLEIAEADKVLWSRTAPPRPVRIERFDCRVSDSGTLEAVWSVAAAQGTDVDHSLRWSQDGESWHGLATGLGGTEASVDLAPAPSGKVLIQLVAHDGFFSATSKAVTIEVPRRVPQVAILHPVDGHTYVVGQTLRLAGAATSSDGEEIDRERYVWSLDGKQVGRGPEAFVAASRAGEHRLELRVEHDYGVGEARVVFRTIAPPKPPRPPRRRR